MLDDKKNYEKPNNIFLHSFNFIQFHSWVENLLKQRPDILNNNDSKLYLLLILNL